MNDFAYKASYSRQRLERAQDCVAIEDGYGTLDENGFIKSDTSKFYGFPWHLVHWYISEMQDDTCGGVDDIGYHARFYLDPGNAHAERIEWGIDDAEIIGYIVREDDAGTMTFESYKDDASFDAAWSGIEDRHTEYYRIEQDEIERQSRLDELSEQIHNIQAPIEAQQKCPQCVSIFVNRIFTHEHGCPISLEIARLEQQIEDLGNA